MLQMSLGNTVFTVTSLLFILYTSACCLQEPSTATVSLHERQPLLPIPSPSSSNYNPPLSLSLSLPFVNTSKSLALLQLLLLASIAALYTVLLPSFPNSILPLLCLWADVLASTIACSLLVKQVSPTASLQGTAHRFLQRFCVFTAISFLSNCVSLYLLSQEPTIFLVYFATRMASCILAAAQFILTIYQTSSITDQAIFQEQEDIKASGKPLPSPEVKNFLQGPFSVVYFTWMNPLMRLGSRRPLKMEDLPELSESEKAENAVKRYQIFKKTYSCLPYAIFASESRGLIFATICSIFSTCLGLSGPYFLFLITGYIQDPKGEPLSQAFLYAVCFGASSILRGLFNNHAWHIARKMSMRIKAVLVNEIYCKSLRRIPSTGGSSKATKGEKDGEKKEGKDEDEDASVGKIVTLMSTDAETIRDTLPEMYDLFLMPVQCLAAILGLLYVVGWPALMGLGVMVATLPATYYNSKWSMSVYDKLLERQDARTTVVNEVLQGIRIIKYFAWERKFIERIDVARDKEMWVLIETYCNGATNTFIWFMTPVVVAFVTLVTLTKFSDQEMSAQLAFTCLSLFNNLRIPLMAIPYIINDIFRLKVAFDRLSKFLNQDELERFSPNSTSNVVSATKKPRTGETDGVPSIGFKDGVFQWYTSSSGNNAVVVEDIPSGNESTPLLHAQRNASERTVDSSAASQNSFTLKEINIDFPVGVLTAICGATGAGKSSLLQALLGEMKRISGNAYLPQKEEVLSSSSSTASFQLNGGVAYVAQTSWLQNATIRDNIVFGEDYDPVRYDKVIKACALVKDLENLEAGDLTEIGEKGINLSGGQKQRVSLARAVYSRASFILLDDPLSAVDAPTSKHLFEKAICGPLMKNRTRILVTHATSLVLKNRNTKFLVAIQSGSILAAAPVAEALRVPGVSAMVGVSEVRELHSSSSSASLASTSSSTSYGESGSDCEEKEEEMGPLKDYGNGKTVNTASKLIDQEGRSTGAIDKKFYFSYLANAGGVIFVVLVFIMNFGDRAINIGRDYWVKVWAEAYDRTGNASFATTATVLFTSNVRAQNSLSQSAFSVGTSNATYSIMGGLPSAELDYYITVYGAISGFWVLAFLASFAIRMAGSYRASKRFHAGLIERIMYAPMRFFDTTPIGRILNRATKDISVIDGSVMYCFADLLETMTDALMVLALVAAITPIFVFALIPILLLYFSVSSRFLSCQREIKRLDSNTRSPIYSMFSETLVGVSTIRAYSSEDRFIKENLNRVDTNHRAFFYMWCANRWFGTRVGTIAGFVILISAIGTVSMRNVVGPGLAGLSLTMVLTFSDLLVWIVRIHAQLEMNMNAVERVTEYMEIEQEAPAHIEATQPGPNWPSRGSLSISNLEMRYAPDQPSVLSDVTFSVKGGEKVGIVGRTGAGKSSLSLSLFRVVEPSKGTIIIDGVDISRIGLYDLRSKLTMIPQDPVLFAGTIRTNLDPFDEYDDAKLWSCLKQVRFMESMQTVNGENSKSKTLSKADSQATLDGIEIQESSSSMSESERTGVTLEYAVTEGGGNFSQGQRQLLCLARALLKSSAITVFDEATASVDNETDACIQQAIRGPSFRSTTVLSIAHRLRTIADYDKILVLEKGRVAQFGTPLELMQAPGIFQNMCRDSGEEEALLAMAKGV